MAGLPGQIETSLPGGELVLSSGKTVAEGARAALLLAPGRFRLDVRPQEDALMIAVRPLAAERISWEIAGARERRSEPVPDMQSVVIEGSRWRARVTLGSVHDAPAGLTRFVAQARVTPATAWQIRSAR